MALSSLMKDKQGYVIKTIGCPDIHSSDITKCDRVTLEDALRLAGESPDKSQFITNINAQIASLKNHQMQASLGPTYNSEGVYIGETVFIGNARSDGIKFAHVDASTASRQGVVGESVSEDSDNSSIELVPPQPLLTSTSPQRERTFSKKLSKDMTLQESLSGSDLSVFYIAEVIDPEDRDLPKDAARKNLIMIEFDSVLSLSYSTIRERFPIRSLGSTCPKAMTAGIRTISGHIAFNIFAEDVLSRLRGRVVNELERQNREAEDELSSTPLAGAGYKSMLLDQLPPFHLLIMGVNENGVLSRMMIKDVHIIDENQYQGTQQPNIVNKVTFVAKDIVPMTARQYDSTFINGSLSSMEESYVGGNWELGMGADLTASSLIEIESDSVYRSAQVDGGY